LKISWAGLNEKRTLEGLTIKTKSFWNGASTRLVAGGWIHNGKARKTRAGS
jgi:hypothetical protein